MSFTDGYIVGYTAGGLLGALFVSYFGQTFAEAALVVVLGALVVVLLSRG